jgi:Mn2+/Fe2+ NRAMP family transporter
MSASASSRSASVGEVFAVSSLWAAVLVIIIVTYARLDVADLYHVSENGLEGGLSRALVETNFPLSLVAIAIAIVALDVLPKRAWWVGVPAILLCAVTAWPGVVDQDDLDAKLANALPATGVALVLALSLFALREVGPRFAPRRRFDSARLVVGAVVLVLSIPWIVAELGFFLSDGLFLMQKLGRDPDGTVLPAVHLGHHHGLDGSVLVLSGLLLSRVRLTGRRVGLLFTGYVALMLAYGAMQFAEDGWHEQLVKRGWLEWKIPSALEPKLAPVWIVTLGLAAVTALVLRGEQRKTAS